MLHHSVLTTVVVLLGLTTATTPPPPSCDATCRSNVLAFLSGRCQRKLAANGPACIDAVASQASAFCTSFLTPTTVHVNTTPSITVTATTTTTSTTTAVTTTTDVTTTTATTTISTSTTTTYILPSSSLIPLRRGLRPSACPDLSTPRLLRLAPTKVSSLCELLGVTAPASTVSSTTTATATALTTLLTIETSLTVTTESTTSTTTTAAIATATRVIEDGDEDGVCNGQGYESATANSGSALTVRVPGTTPRECCLRCWETPGCAISNAEIDTGMCELYLVSDTTSEGGVVSETCPLGVWNVVMDEPSTPTGPLFRGPCYGGGGE